MSGLCRICSCPLPEIPCLLLPSQPAMAQHLPEPGRTDENLPESVDLLIKECPCCGVVQLDNQPVNYYREVIRAGGFSPAMMQFRKRQFAAFSQRYDLKGKSIMEFGCGNGEYLQCWRNVDACGMEYSPENCRQARQKGFKVFQGYPGECLPPGRPFDGFAVFSWLEHLPDLPRVLKNIRASLKQTAVGLVEVPDFDMIRKQNLFSEFILDHLFYFTRKTLQTTLELHGFEVLRCRSAWQGYILSAEVRPRPSLQVTGFRNAQKKLLQDIRNFLEQQPGKTAVWGAGHQALALLALCDKTDRICYVVDSAVFKQNRLTPVSHLLIVPPERLLNNPPEAILIMAGSYNQEIAKQIRMRFPNRFRVACIEGQNLKEL